MGQVCRCMYDSFPKIRTTLSVSEPVPVSDAKSKSKSSEKEVMRHVSGSLCACLSLNGGNCRPNSLATTGPLSLSFLLFSGLLISVRVSVSVGVGECGLRACFGRFIRRNVS